jgi:mannose-6-phosphate isomerase-like protein (cupin superfamily)
MAKPDWQTKDLLNDADYAAPDTSEIRLLLTFDRGGLAHCTLPVGATSLAVAHKTVDEIWLFLEGRGEVWRRAGDTDEIVEVAPGRCLTIPVGTAFQFRNTGDGPLRFVISTMPAWPGPEEARRTDGRWD